MSSPRRNAIESCLLKLSIQAVIHTVWRERNNRKHNNVYRTAAETTQFIDKMIRSRISSLRPKNKSHYGSVMQRWMGCYG
ncbi:hypothetical protein F2Q70_00043104 [Brassica cretica]|uniref:Uncharacterized protein n=1 Tax=Brassica cretica TaxID=69181 RepID=A0A8S9KIV4_BRACR|nr:hypothetical protein F2Q70_00043104 [Brassica cretica]